MTLLLYLSIYIYINSSIFINLNGSLENDKIEMLNFKKMINLVFCILWVDKTDKYVEGNILVFPTYIKRVKKYGMY